MQLIALHNVQMTDNLGRESAHGQEGHARKHIENRPTTILFCEKERNRIREPQPTDNQCKFANKHPAEQYFEK